MFRIALLLWLALLPFSGRAAAVPGSVDAILDRHAQHGIVADRAYSELASAVDRPGANSPAAAHNRFWFAMGLYAAMARNTDATNEAVAQLERLAAGGQCGPCKARALLVQGSLLVRTRGGVQARKYLSQLEAQPPSDPETLAHYHYFRGHVLGAVGEFDEAIASGLEAAHLADKLGLPALQVRALNGMVLANAGRRDLNRAEALSNDAMTLARRIGDIESQALLRNNQAIIYSMRKDPKRALQALQDVFEITRRHPELRATAMLVQVNLADYHVKHGNYAEALKYGRQAEQLALALNDKVATAVALLTQGRAMAELGRPEAGIALLRKAIAMGEQADAKLYVVNMTTVLMTLLDENGRSREAVKLAHHIIKLNNELVQSQREDAILDMQEKYSAERKSREIERLSLENARKQAEVNARAWQQRMWAALAATLLLAAALLTHWLRTVRRRNRSLEVDNLVLSEQSSQDPLTGAFNRRYCQQLMSRHEARWAARSDERRPHPNVSLVLLDIDFFKKVNDVQGHAVGDAVLVEVARRLQSVIREQDALVRWGGEEFVLVLPGTPAEGLTTVVERVLHAIGGEPIDAGGQLLSITVSAGCVAWPVFSGQHWEDALHVADLALYLSKSRGRNRATVLAEVSPDAQGDLLRHDLNQAEAHGDARLVTVFGPAVDHVTRAAAEH